MKKLKHPILVKNSIDPYQFIDEYIILPWLFVKDPPTILFVLCSKLPFKKRLTNLISNPDIAEDIVDDDENLIENYRTESKKISYGEEDLRDYIMLTGDEAAYLRDIVKLDYYDRPAWKEKEQCIKKLFIPLSAPKPVNKKKVCKYPERPKGRLLYSIEHGSYVKTISFLIREYEAMMEIQQWLYDRIDEIRKHPNGHNKLSNYFGNWKKAGPRKKLLLAKLIAGIERIRRYYNPSDDHNKCAWRKACALTKCPSHPRYNQSHRLFKQSAREMPYVLSKLGIFTGLTCKYKQFRIKCSAITCFEDRIKKCEHFSSEIKNYCKNECVYPSNDVCPIKIPCQPGLVKYRNERRKKKLIPSITEL